VNAAVCTAFGGPEVLRYHDVPDPVPAVGEAVIRVRACSVTHLDVDIRAGLSRLPIRLPHILGRDMAGEIVRVDGAGAQLSAGTKVVAPLHLSCMRPTCPFCSTGRDNICPERHHPGVDRQGNYAELNVYPADSLLLLPDGLDFIEAVAGLQTFATAWHTIVDILQLRPGESVLITGAAGGVGSSAVQVAILAGARVIAAAGSEPKLVRLAEHVQRPIDTINYGTHDLTEETRRLTDGRGVDAVVEVVGGIMFQAALAALAQDGRLAVTGGHSGEVVPLNLVDLFRRQQRLLGSSAYSHADVRTVLRLMAAGALRPLVDRVLPLRDAAEAHRVIEARQAVGKIVMIP
jgi:NADPH:quinone reductase-like Zn-dependent oxidoreductase